MDKKELDQAIKNNESFLLDKEIDVEILKIVKAPKGYFALINVLDEFYPIENVAVSINRIQIKNRYFHLKEAQLVQKVPEEFKTLTALFNCFDNIYGKNGKLIYEFDKKELVIKQDCKKYQGIIAVYDVGINALEED